MISEKYRPSTLSDLILRKEIKKSIVSWINQWRSGNPGRKALLLHGQPGIGKTTVANVISKEMGYPIIEINSSEKRGEAAINEFILIGGSYGDITNVDENSSTGPKKIILVDEADNIFEGSGDRGGIMALAKAIPRSKNPIIITMNDFYEFRRRNGGKEVIANCLVIEMKPYQRKKDADHREYVQAVKKRLMEIARIEGITIRESSLEKIIEKNDTDIRGMINDLESFAGIEGREVYGNRDSVLTPYAVTDMALRGKDPLSAYTAFGEVDIKPEDILMWLDRNAMMVAVETEDLDAAYNLLSLADLFMGRIRRKQHYGFTSFAMELSSALSTEIKLPNPHYTKYEFPSFIGLLSSNRRATRARRSVALKYGKYTHAGQQAALSDLWFLRFMMNADSERFRTLMERLAFTDAEQNVVENSL